MFWSFLLLVLGLALVWQRPRRMAETISPRNRVYVIVGSAGPPPPPAAGAGGAGGAAATMAAGPATLPLPSAPPGTSQVVSPARLVALDLAQRGARVAFWEVEGGGGAADGAVGSASSSAGAAAGAGEEPATAEEAAVAALVDDCVAVAPAPAPPSRSGRATSAPAGAAADRFRGYVVDIGDALAVEAAARRVERDLGTIDSLVYAADVVSGASMVDLDPRNVVRTFKVNVLGFMWCIRAILPGMLRQDSGHIVAVSSLAGEVAVPKLGDYGASKAALSAALAGVREEIRLAGKGGVLTSLVVSPHFVASGLFDGAETNSPIFPTLSAGRFASLVGMECRHASEVTYLPGVARFSHLAAFLPRPLLSLLDRRLFGFLHAMDNFRGGPAALQGPAALGRAEARRQRPAWAR